MIRDTSNEDHQWELQSTETVNKTNNHQHEHVQTCHKCNQIVDTVNLMGVYNLFDKAGTHLNEVESLCEGVQNQACFLTGILHMTQDETHCNSIYQSHPSLYHQDVLNAPSLQHMLRILIYYKVWQNKFFSF